MHGSKIHFSILIDTHHTRNKNRIKALKKFLHTHNYRNLAQLNTIDHFRLRVLIKN